MNNDIHKWQHAERTKLRDEVERYTRQKEYENFKAITGIYPVKWQEHSPRNGWGE